MFLVDVFFHFLLFPIYHAGIVSFMYKLIATSLIYIIINRCPIVICYHINTFMNYE